MEDHQQGKQFNNIEKSGFALLHLECEKKPYNKDESDKFLKIGEIFNWKIN